MEEKIMKLNSIPMLWISGLFLLASFLTEYIFPLMEISFVFPINPAWLSLLISGIPLFYLAVVNTLDKRITSVLLISIAMVAAIYIGDIFAAGEIAFIMAIGEFLEDRTVEKAKKGIEMLFELVPVQGRVVSAEEEKMVDAKDIKENDILRVFPGESFPADGTIILGTTTIDQSIMTGESLPIDKSVGDEVFTGTINRFGSVDIKVTKSFANSSLQKMIQLVEDAENQKAPTQKIVDKWAGVLVPMACIIAIVTYFIFSFLFNRPDDALIRSVTVLVVFCPCALALATPTSIMAAIGQATKNGVLIKSGEALELMGNITTVCFDKTGTITHGKLMVSDIQTMDFDKDELLSLTASVESRSEHPIGKAMAKYANEQNISFPESTDFMMLAGKGVRATSNDKLIYCGNERLLEEEAKLSIPEDVTAYIASLREEGKAIIIVATNERVLGVIGLSDKIKQNARTAIETLQSVGIDKTVLLTGDNEKSANFISKQVGISEVHSSLLPADKVFSVKQFMEHKQHVCMVGDGVNDAPALKTASVGIAMGTMGSDIAVDAADIAIMGDDISKIAYIKKLSNATIFSIKFNITMSMVINFVAIVLSVTGILNPATGALVHNAGSVLVVLNAARLYDKKI
ncbi:MAG: cation-translocating P-type ATPase [Bacillota bacterium]